MMPDLATLYEILDGTMDNRLPPQWAIDEAQAIFGKIEFDGYVYGTAYVLAKERERCAKIVEAYAESFTLYSYQSQALGDAVRKIRES